MDRARFEEIVDRLKEEAEDDPARYRRRVALLAAAGFGLLALVVGFSIAVLAGLAWAVVLLVVSGGKFAILLLKLGKLLVLVAIPVWVMVRGAFQAVFTRFPKPPGHEITAKDAPALFARLDWMRKTMRGPKFHHVLVTPEMNAAVVQRPLLGLVGMPRNYLILGLPLLETLSEPEALAVLAHEYGHLAGGHGRFAAFIFRLRFTWSHIGAVAAYWKGWGGKLLGGLLGRFAPYFNAYTFVLARQDELDADAAAARLVGAEHARDALKRVSIAAGHYDAYLKTLHRRVASERTPPADALGAWGARIQRAGADLHRSMRLLDTSLKRVTDCSDTHPALADRLRALGFETTLAARLPRPVPERATAAAAWLGAGHAQVGAAVQRVWQSTVGPEWSERHAQIRKQRARIEALAAKSDRTQDEEWEFVSGLRQTDPERDTLGEVDAYIARHPADSRGHFERGMILLDREDAAGIASLETAMKGDAETIVPASMAIYEFLIDRDRDRARAYLDRLDARQAVVEQAHAEFDDLRAEHALRPCGWSKERLAWLASQVRVAIDPVRKSVIAVHFVRRELPSDPALETYLVAIEVDWMGRRRGHDTKALQAIAAIAFERPVAFVALDGEHKALAARVRGVRGSAVEIG